MCEIQPYPRVRDTLQDGDVLLFRRPGSLIATTGRGDYSHAGMVLVTHGRRLCMEVREWHGGRAVMLSRLVPIYADGIDVYRVKTTTVRLQGAVNAMMERMGSPYGYRGVWRAFLARIPLIGRCCRSPVSGGEFCSQAVAASWAEAGIDLVPRLADHRTEPSDLARSSLLNHVVRIAP